MALITVILALASLASFHADNAQLRFLARELTQSQTNPTQLVLAMTDWVHHNQSPRENPNGFVLSRLRATPIQVLRDGGDCADKSRLLCALLRELGISSTMVLCFSRDSHAPTHTVVEVQTGPETFMVVDPAYNLAFPRNHQNSFHDLLDLRADPQILDRRLAELIPTLPPTAPVYCYKPQQAAYDNAATFNWQKNTMTRILHDLLLALYGENVYRIPRPMVLEEPKLALATLLGVASAFLLGLSRMISRPSIRSLGPAEGRVVPCGQ